MRKMKRMISIILVLMLSIMMVSTFSFAENELPENNTEDVQSIEKTTPISSDEDNSSDDIEISSEDFDEEVAAEITEDDIDTNDDKEQESDSDRADSEEDTEETEELELPEEPESLKKIEDKAATAGKAGESVRAVYEINTVQDLYNIRNYPSRSYILMCDLDLSKETSAGGTYYNSGKGWSPICSGSTYFTGTFDGNSHTISGLYSKGTNLLNGLFGVNQGTIKNLTIENANLVAQPSGGTGILVGLNNGTIDSCNAKGTITFNGSFESKMAGGIVGLNKKTINNCAFEGEINISGQCTGVADIGGIVGTNDGVVNNSNNRGNLVCALDGDGMALVGGLAGGGEGMIAFGSNYGSIKATTNSGTAVAAGIIGYAFNDVDAVYNYGSVYAYSEREIAYAGGIAGASSGGISYSFNRAEVFAGNNNANNPVLCGGIAGVSSSRDGSSPSISFSTNEAKVSAKGKKYVRVGGISGSILTSEVENSYNKGAITGTTVLASGENYTECGGIVGYLYNSNLFYSYNTGSITADGPNNSTYESYAGGIVGNQEGSDSLVKESYNTGSVTSKRDAGGICGRNSAMVLNCYNVGLIQGADDVGGIVGCNIGSDAIIFQAYNVGRLITNSSYKGGIVGYDTGYYVDTDCVTISYASAQGSAYGRTCSYTDMLKSSTYESLPFGNIWTMGTGPYKFPVLVSVIDNEAQANIDLCKCIKMHPYGAWKTTKAPTATTTGIDSRSCYFCGLTETKTSTPTGNVTILNTIANSAQKTNDVIWDKSKIKGATNYQINWRARGASKWASRNVGNTVRGTTSGLTIGNVYEIRVRPYANDMNTSKPVYGSWSNTVYRYFHTTEKIRLASRSKGTFTMSWKSNPNATSYQVLYTTNANGSGAAQNIKTAKKGATSITVSDIKVNGKAQKLKSGTTYYVQVREIRNINGTNYIGNISCPVAVKVK